MPITCLRLTPVPRDGQRVHLAALQILPEPMHRREGSGFFRQPSHLDRNRGAARDADGQIGGAGRGRSRPSSLSPQSTPPWEEVREEAFAASDIGPLSPAHFLFPSRMVSLDPEIRDYTRESFSPERPHSRSRDRADRPAQGRHRLRDRRDHRHHHAADVVRAAPRRMPGFRAHHDLRPARHRSARRLCQRLSA